MDSKKRNSLPKHKSKICSLTQKTGYTGSIQKRLYGFTAKHQADKESHGHGDTKQTQKNTNNYLEELKQMSIESVKNREQFVETIQDKDVFRLQPVIPVSKSGDVKTRGFESSMKSQKHTSNRVYRSTSYTDSKKDNTEIYTVTEIPLANQQSKSSSFDSNNISLSKTSTTSFSQKEQLLSSIDKLLLNEEKEISKEDIIQNDKNSEKILRNSCKICGNIFDDLKKSAKKLAKTYFVSTTVFMNGKNRECFQCKLCEKTERLRNYIEKHILEHMAQNELTCEECQLKRPEVFAFISQVNPAASVTKVDTKCWFSEKLILELSKIPMYCKRCDADFCHANTLLEQVICSEVPKNESSNKEIQHVYTCKLCNDTGIGISKSIMHICDHIKSEDLCCDSCRPYFSQTDPNQLTTSFIQLWPEETVECSNCTNAMEQDEVLLIDVMSLNNNHEIKASNLHIVYICRICQFKSYQKNRMARHFKNHMERNYILCAKCQVSRRKR